MRLTVLLTVLAMLVPATAGGAPFVWCQGMHRAQLECCCHSAHDGVAEKHDAKRDGRDSIGSDCCIGHRVDAASANTGAAMPDVFVHSPAVIAWLTLDALLGVHGEPSNVPHAARHRHARAGPEPPRYALVCSYLI